MKRIAIGAVVLGAWLAAGFYVAAQSDAGGRNTAAPQPIEAHEGCAMESHAECGAKQPQHTCCDEPAAGGEKSE